VCGEGAYCVLRVSISVVRGVVESVDERIVVLSVSRVWRRVSSEVEYSFMCLWSVNSQCPVDPCSEERMEFMDWDREDFSLFSWLLIMRVWDVLLL
jgi:hypothetical protein